MSTVNDRKSRYRCRQEQACYDRSPLSSPGAGSGCPDPNVDGGYLDVSAQIQRRQRGEDDDGDQ